MTRSSQSVSSCPALVEICIGSTGFRERERDSQQQLRGSCLAHANCLALETDVELGGVSGALSDEGSLDNSISERPK